MCSACRCEAGFHGAFCQFSTSAGLLDDSEAAAALFVGPIEKAPLPMYAFPKTRGVTKLYSVITGVPEDKAYQCLFPEVAALGPGAGPQPPPGAPSRPPTPPSSACLYLHHTAAACLYPQQLKTQQRLLAGATQARG